MSVDRLSPWRRTGRKASDEHYAKLQTMSLVEFPGYDNLGNHQGKVLACLSNEEEVHEGKLFMGHVLAVEDGYYEYWVNETFGKYQVDRLIPFHFCAKPIARCGVDTRYRSPIHVDVYRLVKYEQLDKLQWLTQDDWTHIRANPLVISLGADAGVAGTPAVPAAAPKAGAKKDRPDEVRSGRAGIEGLAQALGAGEPLRPADARGDETSRSSEEEQKHKKKKEKKRKKARKRSAPDFAADEGDLREAINQRAPKEPRLSALDLSSLNKGGTKKKKKKNKSKDKSEDDRRSSSPSTSSSGSLFHSAALPKGLERLRRVHQKYPGKIASLSLLRMRELVAMTLGRGTAEESENPLPAVATPYLIQVLFSRYPAGEVPIRTMRELRTVAAVIDLVVSNDPLRALDVLVQRFKALELAHEQQSWAQASQLELILSDQTSAVFRQEVTAAQAEVKSNWQLEAGPQRSQRWRAHQPWVGSAQGSTSAQKEGSPGQSDDKPPLNTAPVNKGKGKGKKGRGKRRW